MTDDQKDFMDVAGVTHSRDFTVLDRNLFDDTLQQTHGFTAERLTACQKSLLSIQYIQDAMPPSLGTSWEPRFKITRQGMKQWLLTQYGSEEYSELIRSIRKESSIPGTCKATEIATKLGLATRRLAQLRYAENIQL